MLLLGSKQHQGPSMNKIDISSASSSAHDEKISPTVYQHHAPSGPKAAASSRSNKEDYLSTQAHRGWTAPDPPQWYTSGIWRIVVNPFIFVLGKFRQSEFTRGSPSVTTLHRVWWENYMSKIPNQTINHLFNHDWPFSTLTITHQSQHQLHKLITHHSPSFTSTN